MDWNGHVVAVQGSRLRKMVLRLLNKHARFPQHAHMQLILWGYHDDATYIHVRNMFTKKPWMAPSRWCEKSLCHWSGHRSYCFWRSAQCLYHREWNLTRDSKLYHSEQFSCVIWDFRKRPGCISQSLVENICHSPANGDEDEVTEKVTKLKGLDLYQRLELLPLDRSDWEFNWGCYRLRGKSSHVWYGSPLPRQNTPSCHAQKAATCI